MSKGKYADIEAGTVIQYLKFHPILADRSMITVIIIIMMMIIIIIIIIIINNYYYCYYTGYFVLDNIVKCCL